MLRHTLATLAYRAARTLAGASPAFATFHISEGTRTPAQVVAHCGDLLDWALCLADGAHKWRDSEPLPWAEETARFFERLRLLDERLASGVALQESEEQIFQGPIADALTHVGQIAMLRRMAGEPIRGENYFLAGIAAGRVGLEQERPRREFD